MMEEPKPGDVTSYAYNEKALDEFGYQGSFSEREITDPEVLHAFVESHDAIFSDKERFLGKGNNALVYDVVHDGGLWCVKNRWSSVSVESKSKQFGKMPENYKNLRKIQEYFQEVNAKKRKMQQMGIEFEPQNNPLVEATLTNRAAQAASDAGLKGFIPRVSNVLVMSREEEGFVQEDPKDPYFVNEEVSMLLMEKIYGCNIQEAILEWKEHEELRSAINFDDFASKAQLMLEVVHKAGIVHKDISIRNLMIDRETGDPRLIDFGASRYSMASDTEGQEKDVKDLQKVLNLLKKSLSKPEESSSELTQRLDKLDNI